MELDRADLSADYICERCNRDALVPSVIEIHAGYGSERDGDKIMAFYCGDCIDKMIDEIVGSRQRRWAG